MSALTRQYAKLCDVGDFADPDLLRVAAEILPERDPATHVERKVWEFAMLALFLEELGILHEGTHALAVGAGDERMVFWLANRLGRVVATDIYGRGEFSGKEAQSSMLEDPAAHAPFPYRADRLEVSWMDARELQFEDASFDLVFSLSSIEHFGHPTDVVAAAREIGRVLKPQRHAFIVTECLAKLHPLDRAAASFAVRAGTLGRRRPRARLRWRPDIDAFTAREMDWWIVRPSGLRLMQPLDRGLSDASWENLTRLHPDATLESASSQYYPHVLLTTRRSVFTSVCLPLEKPAVDAH